jgi:hypothetical protein
MAEPDTDDMVAPGWDVYDSDGERIGSVEEVTATWLRIDGELGRDLFVPISNVEAAAGGRVSLDTPASDAASLGWDQPPQGSRTEELLEEGSTDR